MDDEAVMKLYDRCDVYTDFGPLHRGMMLTDAALKRLGRDKVPPEELNAAEDAFTHEERHAVYLAGIMATGKTEAEALEILKDEAIGGVGEDPWEEWYIAKLVSEGELDADEWGK